MWPILKIVRLIVGRRADDWQQVKTWYRWLYLNGVLCFNYGRQERINKAVSIFCNSSEYFLFNHILLVLKNFTGCGMYCKYCKNTPAPNLHVTDMLCISAGQHLKF